MKTSVSGSVAAILLGGTVMAQAQMPTNFANRAEEPATLLTVGPVESINAKTGTAVVLGQQVVLQTPGRLNVGESVAVIGKALPDGRLAASAVLQEGNYVAGATRILLTGIVQANNAALGRAVVNGINVDLTPMMSDGAISLSV